ncbi:MAG: pentapeptide repeat-containing protein [Candidatus Babeliaceae bacterium]|jgi:hypothetical protein
MKLSHKILIFALMAAGSFFSAFATNNWKHIVGKTGKMAVCRGCNFQGEDVRAFFGSMREQGFVLDVREANFKGANLEGVDLTGSYINGANLTGANLKDAKLVKVFAAGTIFDNAHLEGAVLENINATLSSFKGAIFSDATTVNKCYFFWSDFRNSNIDTATIDANSEFKKALYYSLVINKKSSMAVYYKHHCKNDTDSLGYQPSSDYDKEKELAVKYVSGILKRST